VSVPIDRRAFVGLALAGAAGLASAAAGSASLAPDRRRSDPADRLEIRKALKVGMIGVDGTLTDKFAAARDAGFEGVELDSPGPYGADEVLEARERTGMEVPGVVLSTHWSKPFNHPDPAIRAEARDALRTALRDCKAFGGSSVLVVPAVVNQSMKYADAYRMSQEAMREAAPLAAELGIRIAFENVWNNFLLSPLEAARYSDELQRGVDRPVFGWHFDIGNIVNYGWPEHWIEALGPRILKLDVKEFSRKRRDDEGLWKGFGVEIGEGDVGWDRVRAALRRIGYRGWAAAEVGGGGPERLADIARRMDTVFREDESTGESNP
jgi:hexulose-6-phosphate isomerase